MTPLPRLLVLLLAPLSAVAADRPAGWIACSEFRTNLPTRHDNFVTMRAWILRADGSGGSEVAPSIIDRPDTWCGFEGWSADGRYALLTRTYNPADNAAFEENNNTFRIDRWQLDGFLVEIRDGRAVSEPRNLTGPNSPSRYNPIFFLRDDPHRLGWNPLIDGKQRAYSMNFDGTDRRETIKAADNTFTYGYLPSPDGKVIAYLKHYQIYLSNADGSDAKWVNTGQEFNGGYEWSPDGQTLLFIAGKRKNANIYVVNRDGSNWRKIADVGGYESKVSIIDVPDYHDGSSNGPAWSPDGKWIYYTAKVGDSSQIMRVSLDGKIDQLTFTPPGTLNYMPRPSPDGRWICFGSNRDGIRQLYVMSADGRIPAYPITHLTAGHGALWPKWQPIVRSN
jgi:Tol biopolymer transport system component